jgi:hypothetical protein
MVARNISKTLEDVLQAQLAEADARAAEQKAASERAALQQRIGEEQSKVVFTLASGLSRWPGRSDGANR